MDIMDKLTTANDNVPLVHNCGHDCIISQIDSFEYLFYNGARLGLLNYIKSSDTKNITKFKSAFYNCTIGDAPDLDISNGTDFSNMFASCKQLTTVPLYDVRKGLDFSGMFSNCTKLISVKTLNAIKGTNFQSLFLNDSSLTQIPSIDTSSASNIRQMYSGCTKITSVPEITGKPTTAYNYCYGCTNLETVGHIDMSNITSSSDTTYMFLRCPNLKNITLSNIKVNMSFKDSPLLTTDSLTNIINNLKDYSGTTSANKNTLTLNSTSWTNLEAVTPPDGYETWKDYVSNGKGWKYA